MTKPRAPQACPIYDPITDGIGPIEFGSNLIVKVALCALGMFLLGACNSSKEQSVGPISSASCRGIYYSRNNQGDLLKFNEFQTDQGICLTDAISLSLWEKSSEAWSKNNIHCTPQSAFPTVTLKAANNFYQYRDGRLYLSLDTTTGKFRRLIIGEDKNGKPVFQRDMACFYAREDHETEPVNSQDYGKQILLDLELSASSASFTPMEIFKYQTDGTGNWFMTRFDDVADWDERFCPEGTVEWSYCLALRGGNYMYYPNLDAATKAALTIEAKLIRTQFNFTETTKAEFESLWNYHEKNSIEVGIGGDWRYYTQHVPDVPWYIDRSWRDYLMGNRPAMVDVASPRIPPVCYRGSQNVTLSNGNGGRVYGEICYVNGQYTFTQ